MSSTNKTANYELSQFVGTDIPSILSDYNGDMRKIDAGIAEVATSAGSSASAISALAGRVTTAENSITTLNGTVEVVNQKSVQNQNAITGIQGVIPSDASTENLLATVGEVSDVADNVRGVDDKVQAIEAVVPSTASSSNKLATMADITPSVQGKIIMEKAHQFNVADYAGWTELLEAINSFISANYGEGGNLSPVIFANVPTQFPMVYRVNKAQPFNFVGTLFERPDSAVISRFAFGTIDLQAHKWYIGYFSEDSNTSSQGMTDWNSSEVSSGDYPSSGSVSVYGYKLV